MYTITYLYYYCFSFYISYFISNFIRMTGAIGKGLAALTFDDDFQRKRRQALIRKPANFQEGIARSGKGLVKVRKIDI